MQQHFLIHVLPQQLRGRRLGTEQHRGQHLAYRSGYDIAPGMPGIAMANAFDSIISTDFYQTVITRGDLAPREGGRLLQRNMDSTRFDGNDSGHFAIDLAGA